MFHISKPICLHPYGFHLRQSVKRKLNVKLFISAQFSYLKITEFAKSGLCLIIVRRIPLLCTLTFQEIVQSGNRRVKSPMTILSKPKM